MFLASRTMAQLRELAKTTGLSRIYSRLSRYQLIEALEQTLPEPEVSTADTESVAVADTTPAPFIPLPEAPAPAPAPSAEVTQITFLPRDPRWGYVFWTLSQADRERAAASSAFQLCLRVADVTGLPFGASHPHALQEVVVDAGATEWFLPLPLPDRDYRVELGYRLGNGGWLSLAVSSVARMPADGPSELVADQYVPFSLDQLPVELSFTSPMASGGVEHEQMYQRSTAIGQRRMRVGSEAFLAEGESLALDQQQLLHDSGAGIWASGRSESGSGLVRPRSFWLVADAELIVYGATEPSANLFIGDQHVPLDADGTFRVHVPFRDGEQVYPIRAVAADGEQERWIELDFQRQTPKARVNSKEAAVLEWF